MTTTEDFIKLRDELKVYVPLMQQAAELVRVEDISNYPIMVIHKQELELGIPLELSIEMPGAWKIHVSTLEEFVSKQVIENEKVDEFRKLYKQHDNHLCLFILSQLGAQFVFFDKPATAS